MISFDYLNSLINDVRTLRKCIDYQENDFASCSVSYMPKKKTSFIGYKQGYCELLIRARKGMKESASIRSTSKDYLKFIKNTNGDLIRIENYCGGRLDCLYQVHWVGNVRYLFPFSGDGGYYPTYVYVTKYDGDIVVEEYMVDGTQIVYEAYSYALNDEIGYYYINYVSGGKYPILEERKGVFRLSTSAYEESYNDNWLNHI